MVDTKSAPLHGADCAAGSAAKGSCRRSPARVAPQPQQTPTHSSERRVAGLGPDEPTSRSTSESVPRSGTDFEQGTRQGGLRCWLSGEGLMSTLARASRPQPRHTPTHSSERRVAGSGTDEPTGHSTSESGPRSGTDFEQGTRQGGLRCWLSSEGLVSTLAGASRPQPRHTPTHSSERRVAGSGPDEPTSRSTSESGPRSGTDFEQAIR